MAFAIGGQPCNHRNAPFFRWDRTMLSSIRQFRAAAFLSQYAAFSSGLCPPISAMFSQRLGGAAKTAHQSVGTSKNHTLKQLSLGKKLFRPNRAHEGWPRESGAMNDEARPNRERSGRCCPLAAPDGCAGRLWAALSIARSRTVAHGLQVSVLKWKKKPSSHEGKKLHIVAWATRAAQALDFRP